MKKAAKKEWFIGTWRFAEDGGLVTLEISKAGAGFNVRAFDEEEDFVVSKTEWDGKSLRFETLIPSNGYRTRNSLTLTSRTKLVQELTFWETWEKIPTKRSRKKRL